ncbi:XK-related protein 8 [Gadus morhua]|uniref:XK-related protein n=1 Tax=Gadus morhua TaxID=8049 RepID=A0A8C5BBD7_GADMO|nr:XK-related protein 8-like [Gadus morhua]
MEGELTLNYSVLDFGFSFLGLAFFLVDIALDIWAAVHFYQEGDFIYLGLLVTMLAGSSVLGQLFSWLWYRYEDWETRTSTEGSVSKRVLQVLHIFQLGVYIRYAGVLEVAVCSFSSRKERESENVAVYLSHDLSMLRLIEAFSESAPQLVLMLTVMLQTGDWQDPVTVLKAVGSASAIACSVTLYHRSLRSFLTDKAKQGPVSSLLYFICNLLLIFPRLAALALFAYAQPCYIFAHFLCCWAVLFFLAWCCGTDFMDSSAGEWLYRATVGLIWYFSWFNVSAGRSVYRGVFYHAWMLLDLLLLCGLAFWQTHKAPCITGGVLSPDTVAVMGGVVVAVYVSGLLVKVLYYQRFHPKLGDDTKKPLQLAAAGDCTDGGRGLGDYTEVDSMEPPPVEMLTGGGEEVGRVKRPVNRRMQHLAKNFYS